MRLTARTRPCARHQVLGLCLLNAATFAPGEWAGRRVARLASKWWSVQRRLRMNHVLVATTERGEVVGSVEIHTSAYLRHKAPELTAEQADKLQPYLASLAVRPDVRGRGIGQQLVEAALIEASLTARPGEFLLLQVESNNTAAVRLYDRCGFDEISAPGCQISLFRRRLRPPEPFQPTGGPAQGWQATRRGCDPRLSATDGGPADEWRGAGLPRSELPPQRLPGLLMEAMRQNDVPEVDSGLRSMWAFAGDQMRFVYKNNLTEYLEDAHETARSLPTSFYGMAMFGKSWEMEGDMRMVGGSENPWIAVQLMRSVSLDGRLRRWQWELRRHRRPPNLDCWYVESVGSSDRKGNFDIVG